jgi:ABC-type transport system involved in multi-copper enzyme maturation permease subunit
MNTFAPLAAIAINTLREALRSRLLYTLFAFAVLLILFGVVLGNLSYVESERILQDVGLAAIRISSAALAIFLGVGLLHREVDRRTVYTILSKPISRAHFLFGKYAGLVITLWLQLATMVAVFALVSLLTGAEFGAAHGAAFLLTAVEIALIGAVATLFSAFTTPMLASYFSVGIWLVGHLTRNLRELGAQAESAAVRSFTLALHRVFPDLESLNLSLAAAHGLAIHTADLLWPLVYGAGYALLLLGAAVAIFERRDFR